MINDITVYVNNIEKHESALLAACQFAERHDAKVTGVYVKLDTVEIVRWAGSSPMKMANQYLIDQESHEANTKALFESLTHRFSGDITWLTLNQSMDPVKQMLCTDVIFAQQPVVDELSYVGDESFINHLILQTKRPVIMIPNNWSQGDGQTGDISSNNVGTKILLGWNNSPESMRAASDALPIMKCAEEVKILHVFKSTLLHAEPVARADIEGYLSNRGISTTMLTKGSHEHNGEQSILLDVAHANDINLIVVGGYGHSRLREVIMGGVTKHLIEHSEIPVLFSH